MPKAKRIDFFYSWLSFVTGVICGWEEDACGEMCITVELVQVVFPCAVGVESPNGVGGEEVAVSLDAVGIQDARCRVDADAVVHLLGFIVE